MIDTAALAHRIAKWDTNLSTAPHRIKQEIDAALDPLLVAVIMGERAAAVRVAKSIEAGLHMVSYRGA